MGDVFRAPSLDEFKSQVGGVFSPLSKDVEWNDLARPITQEQFLNHVQATPGLADAFSIPLEDVHSNVYLAEKSARPIPSSYLTDDFMASHAAQFSDGAARVDTTASFNARYQRDIEAGLPFGRQDAVFVSPASLIDNLHATGNPVVMESTLGFPEGAFGAAGSMTRTYVYNPSDIGLRFPQGVEGGANPYWVPGGYNFKTTGGAGLPEMVTNQLPSPIVNPNIVVHQ